MYKSLYVTWRHRQFLRYKEIYSRQGQSLILEEQDTHNFQNIVLLEKHSDQYVKLSHKKSMENYHD